VDRNRACEGRRGSPRESLRRSGEFLAVTWFGPFREHPPESGPRLRELGITGSAVMEAGEEPAGAHLPGMGLGIVPFLEPQPGVFWVKGLADEIVPAFRSDRENPERRRRLPCFNDPEVRKAVVERSVRKASAYAREDILWLSLTNEGTITKCNIPFDFCSCEHCAAGFRSWLRKKYGSLDDLNRSWGTRLSSWDQVTGATTDQAKSAYLRDRNANLCSWFDFRRFMDESFGDCLLEVRDELRRSFPGVPLGLNGTWPPGVFGGQDWERFAGEYDLLESYDEAGEVELVRSLCGQACDLVATFPAGVDPEFWEHSMWMFFIHGFRGMTIDKFRRVLDAEKGFAPTGAGEHVARWLRPMKQVLSPLLAGFERVDDPVLVLHSHASLARAWVEKVFEEEEDWAGRSFGWPRTHDTYLEAERSWYRLIEDAGRQFRVVSARVELDNLPGKGRVLVLPRAAALSDGEIAWISDFLRSGGLVVHDSPIGRFDADLRPAKHEERLPEQARSLAEPGKPVPVGAGRLVRMAAPVGEYARERLEARERLPALRELAAFLDEVLPRPEAWVESARNERVELTAFRKGNERILAVHRNDVRIMFDSPHKGKVPPPEEVCVRLAAPARVENVLERKDLGVTDQLRLVLDPVRPTFLHLKPV